MLVRGVFLLHNTHTDTDEQATGKERALLQPPIRVTAQDASVCWAAWTTPPSSLPPPKMLAQLIDNTAKRRCPAAPAVQL